jgi:hypothetical protein
MGKDSLNNKDGKNILNKQLMMVDIIYGATDPKQPYIVETPCPPVSSEVDQHSKAGLHFLRKITPAALRAPPKLASR